MKLGHSAVPVEVSGGKSASSFSIAMNGKAFRVLSDTLYQNKIGSIVREVSCNAYDAHVMAGKKEVPFVIHLPDSFEPWFSVQDFGVGLSADDITSVFTVYFQSTKDNSNDAVGAFGLGAKTPFSYTDQFTVTSVKDGKKAIYSAYITESGVPSINEMYSADSDEQNGVEIKLSVNPNDYKAFYNETASQLRFFTVKPTITNYNNFEFNTVDDNLAIDTANIAISNNSVGYGQASIHIIQGNVGYPLDTTQLKDKLDNENQSLLSTLQGLNVRIHFNIGQIGVTASREGVEYNKHTIGNINAKLSVVRAELTAYLDKQIAQFTTSWDKALFINDNTVFNRLAKASSLVIDGAKYLNGYYHFDFSDVIYDSATVNNFGTAHNRGVCKMWSHGKLSRDVCSASIKPSSTSKVYIVLRDTANKPNIRAKHFLSAFSKNTSLIEIEMYDGVYDNALIAKITKLVGGFNCVTRLSEVEPPVRVSTATGGTAQRGTYDRPTHYSLNSKEVYSLRKWVKEFDALDEIIDDTVYVVINNMEFVGSDVTDKMGKYVNIASFDDNVLPLVAIRESDLKKIKDNGNYIKIDDYIEQKTLEYTNDKSLHIKWRHATIRSMMVTAIKHNSLISSEIVEALQDNAPKNKITKMISIAFKSRHENSYDDVARFMKWDKDIIVTEQRLECLKNCYNNLITRYPLLAVYNDWQVRRHISSEHLGKYLAVM